MLGALTLPSVSTGFSSDSKSMVPVSIQGMADKVTKMSPLESMQEVFFDIRDGIDNLSTTFSEKISGLNKHLAFRLETLNTTMSQIGNIAAKDLGLEQQQTDIAIENEAERERIESVGDQGDPTEKKDEGKGVFTQSFKDLLDKLTPKSVGMKMGLAGLALAGTMAALSSIEGVIAGTFKFVKEKVIPGLKTGFGELKKDFKNFNENVFGKDGFVPIIAGGLKDIKDGIVEGDLQKSLDGVKTILTDGVVKGIATAGDLAVGLLDATMKTFGYEGDTLEKTQKWFRDLPKNIDGYIDTFLATATGVIDDVRKTYSEEGLFAATKVGFKGLFDNTTAVALNFLSQGASKIADHYGEEETAKKLAALDFSSDKFLESIKSLAYMIYNPETGAILGMDFPNISNFLPTLQEIADSIIMSLPKFLRPDTIGEKIFETKQKIQFQKDQIAEGDTRDGFLTKRTDIIKDLEMQLGELEATLPEDYKQTIDSINNTESRIEKTNVLKSVSEIRATTGAPNNIVIKGGDTNAPKNTIVEGDKNFNGIRAVSVESTGNKILDNFYSGGGL
jgi:hypothetical protein